MSIRIIKRENVCFSKIRIWKIASFSIWKLVDKIKKLVTTEWQLQAPLYVVSVCLYESKIAVIIKLIPAANRQAKPHPPSPAPITQIRSKIVANNKKISPAAKKINPGKYEI